MITITGNWNRCILRVILKDRTVDKRLQYVADKFDCDHIKRLPMLSDKKRVLGSTKSKNGKFRQNF